MLSIISELGNCKEAEEIVVEVGHALCPGTVYSLTALTVGALVIAIITLSGAVVGFNAAKRFNRGIYQELEDFDDLLDGDAAEGITLSVVDYSMWSVYDNVLFWRRLSLSLLFSQVLLGVLHLSVIPFEEMTSSESYADVHISKISPLLLSHTQVIAIGVFTLFPLFGIYAAWRQSRGMFYAVR